MDRSLLLLFFIGIFSFNSLSQNLNDSLIIHYPLNGNANDIGPNNLNGTYFASSATDCAGDTNGATYFDGIDDYIALPNSALLKPALPLSFSFRIKLDQSHSFSHIMGTDGNMNSYSGYWFVIDQNRLGVAYGDGNGASPPNRRTYIGSTQLNLHQWYTITIVISGSQQFTLYVNCQQDIV